MSINILESLNQHYPDLKPTERVMIDGLLSISDEVFELALWKLGVDHETISWRLKEPIENREDVLKMYSRGVRN
jgi:hypothetical protein